jgi:hypothetical protein
MIHLSFASHEYFLSVIANSKSHHPRLYPRFPMVVPTQGFSRSIRIYILKFVSNQAIRCRGRRAYSVGRRNGDNQEQATPAQRRTVRISIMHQKPALKSTLYLKAHWHIECPRQRKSGQDNNTDDHRRNLESHGLHLGLLYRGGPM